MSHSIYYSIVLLYENRSRQEFRCLRTTSHWSRLTFTSNSFNKMHMALWLINTEVYLIGDGSSTPSLSVLLSAVETSLRTQTALEIAQWVSVALISVRIRAPCILAAATIWGWRLFHSELPTVWLLFEGGDYSRAASNTVYNKFRQCIFPSLHLVFINSIAMSLVILPSSSVEGTLIDVSSSRPNPLRWLFTQWPEYTSPFEYLWVKYMYHLHVVGYFVGKKLS